LAAPRDAACYPTPAIPSASNVACIVAYFYECQITLVDHRFLERSFRTSVYRLAFAVLFA